jgi:hypothetical protein
VCLSVDLSCNLKVRNKEQNDYQDACELVENHLDIKSLQVPDAVMESFVAACKQAPEATRKLRIILGKQTYDHSVVRSESSNGGDVLLTVTPEMFTHQVIELHRTPRRVNGHPTRPNSGGKTRRRKRYPLPHPWLIS